MILTWKERKLKKQLALVDSTCYIRRLHDIEIEFGCLWAKEVKDDDVLDTLVYYAEDYVRNLTRLKQSSKELYNAYISTRKIPGIDYTHQIILSFVDSPEP